MKLQSKYFSNYKLWQVDNQIIGLLENGTLKYALNDKVMVHMADNKHRSGYISIIRDDEEGRFIGVRFYNGDLIYYRVDELKKKSIGSIYRYEDTAYPRFTLIRKFSQPIKLMDNYTDRTYKVGETVMLSSNFIKKHLEGTENVSFREDYMFGIIVGFTNHEDENMVAVRMYNGPFGLINPIDLVNHGY